MVASGLDLQGRVSINATPAINSARLLGREFNKLSEEGKVTSDEAVRMAKTFIDVGKAANAERTSIARLATAQAAVNKEMQQANVIAERAAAIKRNSLATAYSTRTTSKARVSAIEGGAANASAVAEGRVALLQQRALTEEIIRQTRVEEAADRSRSRAVRDQIAQQRLLLAQQNAAHAGTLRTTESLHGIRTSLAEAGGALTHFGTSSGIAFASVIANAVVMQRQFANVVRTSDLLEQGFSPAKLAARVATLRGQFDGLAQELPISYKELTQIGAAANQLGVQSQDLAAFTKTVAQFSAVTGVSVDTAATAFGRLNSLIVDVNRNGQMVGGVDNNFQALADSINKVGVNSVATDQQIINISSQIAGIANAAGLGYKEIVGFSGALASVGVSPYLARGLTTRLFGDITKAVSEGGDDLQKFANVAHLSADQFTQAWEKNPKQAILALFAGIREAGPNAIEVLKSLGVTSVLDQPALIRLANAADKTGKAGALLAQTFNDANTAVGENARQYAVISNTVQARLQVALNRVQILFAKIAASNLGPLTDFIGAISDGVLNLSNNLDKPVKLLGLIKLPFTNAQLLGAAVGITGIAAALGLVVGGAAKFVSSILSIRLGITGLQKILAESRGSFAGYTAGAAEASAANLRLATTAEAVSLKLATSNSALARGFGNFIGPTGAGALAKVSNAGSRLGSVIRKVGSGVSGLVGGPVGFAALGLVGIGVLGDLSARADHLGTSVGTVARNMLQLTSSAKILSSIKIDQRGGIESAIGGLFGANDTSAFVKNSKQFGDALDRLKASGTASGGGLTDLVRNMKDLSTLNFQNLAGSISPLYSISRLFAGSGGDLSNTVKIIGKLNDGFKDIANSSGTDAAIVGLQHAFKGLNDEQLDTVLNSDKFSASTDLLKVKLQELGLKDTEKNLRGVAKGTIELNSADATAAKQQIALTEAFKGSSQAANDYIDAVGKAAVAATDLNAAFEQVGAKSKNPFGDFVKNAKKNYQDFLDFQKNALIISQNTGASLADLSKLDPGILAGAVKGGLKNEKKLADLMNLPNAQSNFEAAVAKINQSPQLSNAFSKLGTKAQQSIINSLGKGNDLATAFSGAGKDAANAYFAAFAGVKSPLDAKKLQFKITGDAGPAIKSGEKAADIIGNLKSYIKVNADTLLARKSGEETKDYIGRLKAILQVDGNTAPARKAGESAVAYASRLRATITILGNGAPATRKGESVQQYINRLRGTVSILGNDAPARKKGESARAYIDRLRGTITALANTGQANSALNYAARDRTSTINVKYKGGGGTFATGGYVRGPGTGTSDSIPVRVSNGEYIVRAKAVKENLDLLNQINYGTLKRYASGGRVADDNSARYEGTFVSRQSVQAAKGPAIGVTELSAYDRHLLEGIRDAVGVTVGTDTVSRASHTGNSRQVRRGNG